MFPVMCLLGGSFKLGFPVCGRYSLLPHCFIEFRFILNWCQDQARANDRDCSQLSHGILSSDQVSFFSISKEKCMLSRTLDFYSRLGVVRRAGSQVERASVGRTEAYLSRRGRLSTGLRDTLLQEWNNISIGPFSIKIYTYLDTLRFDHWYQIRSLKPICLCLPPLILKFLRTTYRHWWRNELLKFCIYHLSFSTMGGKIILIHSEQKQQKLACT